MAAGRHGGYRDNKFRDRESDLKLMRTKYFHYSREGYDSYHNGDLHRRCSSLHEIGGEKMTVVRQNGDVEEVVNVGHHMSSDTSNLGTNESFKRKNGFAVKEVFSSENGDSSPPLKKRKFSPIVWDREEKEVSTLSKSRIVCKSSRVSPNTPSKSGNVIADNVFQESSIKTNYFHGLHSSLANSVVLPCSVGSTVPESQPMSYSSSSLQQLRNNDHKQGQIEEEEFVSPNISVSRWSDVRPSLDDKDTTLEVGEFTRGGSLEVRAKSSDSVEEECSVGSVSKGEYSDLTLANNDFVVKDSADITNHSDTDSEGKSYSSNCPKRCINMLQECRSVHEFERLNRIDEGTYGVVFRARDKLTGEIVALKKVKMEKEREGFPLTALREINILLSSHHPSIVDVKEVVMGDLDSIFMVMEYMEHDLKGLMETMRQPFSQSEVKCIMLQLLEGVKYLHDNWVLHRDLKTSNILMNNRGELKICDFGMSRLYGSPSKIYTQLVVTLWYRAPELLLGAKQYSTAIDMWSLGCIMAELLSKEPLFNGKTEVDQLDKIFKTLGTPSEAIWPGFSKLPGVKANFTQHRLPALVIEGCFLDCLGGAQHSAYYVFLLTADLLLSGIIYCARNSHQPLSLDRQFFLMLDLTC